ncbi:hypothetical protein BCR33DRAFT_854540 [Rhizoclosmatium globosum]|uniref:Asteroid domain-containing protein n=1 Tax=Rhizoclosmatium globosum TaxID=329046 RepID=A0A1Y2BSQ0_9FUNG|nr:hypothetical protein BCR33DRAFT_854540 [Rhizoclosmatium globosum]|eukprot:ORY37779.1 hypothetical protein BCR33DRAFT_854540 [Rhizoclosmatium globosum]
MGIRGLSGFLSNATGGATPIALPVQVQVQLETQKPSLIVDGNALVHNKFVGSTESGPALARSVAAFAAKLARVFALTILFDGPLPKWKYQQRLEREKEKIAKIAIDLTDHILSPLTLIACIQSLKQQTEFTVVVAEGEADLAITELARAQDAFISSGDSDFFVHTCRGYLPLDGISVREDGSVSGMLWTNEVVAKVLGIQIEVLPVLAYIAGCDYTIDEKQWQLINSRLGTGHGPGAKRIRAFATHLKPFTTVPDAINSLRPKDSDPTEYESLIAEVTAITDLFVGNFGICPNSRFPPLPCTPEYPPSVIRTSEKSHKFVEILNGAFWCQSIVEDVSRAPAWELSRPIRRRMYHVLGMQSVGEYIRRASDFRIEYVTALDPSPASDDPSTLYNTIMEFNVSADLFPISTQYLPFTASLRFLITNLNNTNNPLKNFELVALICMAIRSSQPPPPYLSTAPKPVSTSQSRSKQTTHLLATLEATLFSAWLVQQAVSNNVALEHAHWQVLDSNLYSQFLMQAKIGQSPRVLLNADELEEFSKIWMACVSGDGASMIDEVVTFTREWSLSPEAEVADQVDGAIKNKAKKKRDASKGRGGGAKKGKVPDLQNLFSILADE